jgi:hypothetical protein
VDDVGAVEATNGRLVTVVFYSLLMVSGAGVRLTGSGLG